MIISSEPGSQNPFAGIRYRCSSVDDLDVLRDLIEKGHGQPVVIEARVYGSNPFDTTMKVCAHCNDNLPVQSFYAGVSGDTLPSICWDCSTAKRHGMHGSWYRSEKRNGCGVCGGQLGDKTAVTAPVPGGYKLVGYRNSDAIDHDHRCCPQKISCGKCTRGVVHTSCNIRLGSYENRVRGRGGPTDFNAVYERYLQKYETPEQTLAAGVDRLPETEKDAA